MKNIKNYKFTFILAVITVILSLTYIFIPSRRIIKDIEIKKISKNATMVEIQAYYVDETSLKSYTFETIEDSYSNLLKATIKDILMKSSKDGKIIKISNIYFSDNSIYFEMDSKNLNSTLKEAIIKTTTELLGATDIKFI